MQFYHLWTVISTSILSSSSTCSRPLPSIGLKHHLTSQEIVYPFSRYQPYCKPRTESVPLKHCNWKFCNSLGLEISPIHHIKAVDKWVLGGAEAPPIFWYFYVKDIAHSGQLLMMYSESYSTPKLKNLSTAMHMAASLLWTLLLYCFTCNTNHVYGSWSKRTIIFIRMKGFPMLQSDSCSIN